MPDDILSVIERSAAPARHLPEPIHTHELFRILRERVKADHCDLPAKLDVALVLDHESSNWGTGIVSGLLVCPFDGRTYRVTVEPVRDAESARAEPKAA